MCRYNMNTGEIYPMKLGECKRCNLFKCPNYEGIIPDDETK